MSLPSSALSLLRHILQLTLPTIKKRATKTMSTKSSMLVLSL